MQSWSTFLFFSSLFSFFFLLIIILIPIKVLFNYCIIIYTYIISYVSMALWCGIDDNWQIFAEVGMVSDGYLFLQRLQYFLPRDTPLWLGRGSNPDLLAPSLTQKLHYHICWLLLLWKLKKKILHQKEKVIVITFLSTMLDL